MHGIAIAFSIIGCLAMLCLPRRWGVVVLLVGTCYMTMAQRVTLGPFDFTLLRLLIAAGIVRVLIRQERMGGIHGLDRIMMAWAAWGILASFHFEDVAEAMVFRLGLAYSSLGIYFLVRIFCQSVDDIVFVMKATAFVLVAVALEMIAATVSGQNFFAMFGGVAEDAAVRFGRIRAQGPFAHSILAGMAGAGCLPLMVGLWRKSRFAAVVGMATTLIIVVASASSGPLLGMAAGGFAWFMWRHQDKLRLTRWLVLGGYILLDLIMKAPAYHLIHRIDIFGGGTAWHRARLIDAAIENFHDWWWAGTEITRHWIAYGVSWSPDHVDITNQYIKLGVVGGLPLMLLFITCFWFAFSYLGRAIRREDLAEDDRFAVWGLGASLFAYSVICLSISFFDQSFVFLYLNFAAVGSLHASWQRKTAEQFVDEVEENKFEEERNIGSSEQIPVTDAIVLTRND